MEDIAIVLGLACVAPYLYIAIMAVLLFVIALLLIFFLFIRIVRLLLGK